MVNLNPRGEARGPNKGYLVPLTSADTPVDTSLNQILFQPPQGLTGVMGLTGLENTSQGITGIAGIGSTGLQGFTGIAGEVGLTGSQGTTGFFGLAGIGQGVTGLIGATGMQGITGLSPGDTGIRGITGVIFQGHTGITGITGVIGITGVSAGSTGIIGDTGILGITGTAGVTGAFGYGHTGLIGVTGLFGTTGISGSSIVVSDTDAGTSLILPIPASTLATNGDQLSYLGSGFTTDSIASTTITLSFGSQNIINFATGTISDVFTVEGNILRLGPTSQETVAALTFDSGLVVVGRAALTQTLSSALNLTLTISSSGSGQEVTQLTAIVIRA